MWRKTSLTVASLAVAIGLVGPLSSPAVAQDQPASAARINTTVSDDIMWFESTVGELPIDRFKVKLFAPTKDGGRFLFQRCSFNFSGAGTYRCGIDVADGSYADRYDGTWVAKVIASGDVIAKTKVSM